MRINMPVGVFGLLIRAISFALDSLIYSAVPWVYKVFDYVVDITNYIKNEQDIVNMVANSIYTLLAVIMVFRLAFSLLSMLADPDKIEDKEKGLSKIVVSVIGCILLTIAVPKIFEIAGEVQKKILDEQVIEKIFVGNYIECKEDTDPSTKCMDNNIALVLSRASLGLFLKPKENIENKPASYDQMISKYNEIFINFTYDNNLENLFEFSEFIDLKTAQGGYEIYVVNYLPFVSTAVGLYLVWIFVTLVLDVAYRSLKLFTLKLLAPIAIISYIDPSSSTKGIFKKWADESIRTYLSIFIRIASLAICSLILFYIKFGTGETNIFVDLFFFLGVLTLIKTLPKMFENIFGIKAKSKEESYGKDLLRAAFGATAAGAVGGIRAGIANKKHNGSFFSGFRVGAREGLLSGGKSAYEGKFGGYVKSLNAGSEAASKLFGYKTGAEASKDKQKFNSANYGAQKLFDKFKNDYDNFPGGYDATALNRVINGKGNSFKDAGINFTDNEKEQIAKAQKKASSLSKYMSDTGVAIRSKIGENQTMARILESKYKSIKNDMDNSNNPAEKAAYADQLKIIDNAYGLANKDAKDGEKAWNQHIEDPSNSRDAETMKALERAEAIDGNTLKTPTIITTGTGSSTTGTTSSTGTGSSTTGTTSSTGTGSSTTGTTSSTGTGSSTTGTTSSTTSESDDIAASEEVIEETDVDYYKYMKERDPDGIEETEQESTSTFVDDDGFSS